SAPIGGRSSCRRARHTQSGRSVAARSDGCALSPQGTGRESAQELGSAVFLRQFVRDACHPSSPGQARPRRVVCMGRADECLRMTVAERKQATAAADAQRWLENFEAALHSLDAAAAAELFLPEGLWRDVLAFTWTIQTMSGRPAIEAMMRETLART